jgi:hypothetical protein
MKEVKPYKEFTFGWIIFAFVIPVYGLQAYLFVNNLGDRPIQGTGFVLVTALMVVICLLFYGMTTRINGDTIYISYGLGLIRKRIPLSRVTSVEPAESPWWYGWGIRLIPKGMMYNISGTESVELKFNDTDRIFRIGTKNPQLLAKEIELRIAR